LQRGVSSAVPVADYVCVTVNEGYPDAAIEEGGEGIDLSAAGGVANCAGLVGAYVEKQEVEGTGKKMVKQCRAY
jgi:hypothetical protein